MTHLPPPPPLEAGRHALLLDFDGTFVDFAARPDAIVLRPGSLELLEAVWSRLGGALAIVSGRRICDIDVFLAPLRFSAVGVHGQESRLRGGDIRLRAVTHDLETARARLAAELGGTPLLLEDKGSAIVLHFREHPDLQDQAAGIALRAVAGLSGIHAVPGHEIVEIREAGVSKADAPAIIAESEAFSGRIAVFAGDDATDEDGFRAVQAVGGFGVKVGPGETAAQYRLDDVGAVHAWLKRIAAAHEHGTPPAA